MKRRAFVILLILLAALSIAGCGGAKSGIDTPAPIDESGSTLANNPAVLKAQNLALAVQIVQQPPLPGTAPGEEPIVAGQFLLTWDPPPPPAVVASYRVERKIGAAGSWGPIADNIPPSERQLVDYGQLGATHYYRVVSFDAEGNFGVSDEVSARIPTFCDYPSGWAMISPPHGCAPFESVFALDAQTVYFAGPRLVVRRGDLDHPLNFRTIDIGTDLVITDLCSADGRHLFAVGYTQVPKEKVHGAALAITGDEVQRIDVSHLERGPLLRIFCDSADAFSAVGARGTALRCGPDGCAAIAGVDRPDLDQPYAAIWGLPSQYAITGATARSLMRMRPDGPPQPLLPREGAAKDPADPAVVDLCGVEGDASPPGQARLFLAADDGIYALSPDEGLRRIGEGRWRRLWGCTAEGFHAAGSGIARFRATPAGLYEKHAFGPPLEFISVDGRNSAKVFLTDSSGSAFERDADGTYRSLFTLWRRVRPARASPIGREAQGARITGLAAAGGRLAISFSGAEEGLLLYAPADNAMQPVPEFHDTDVSGLATVGERIIISSKDGLYAMEGGKGDALSKLSDGTFVSAWDCGTKGICAVRRSPIPVASDDIVLVSPGQGAGVKKIASISGLPTPLSPGPAFGANQAARAVVSPMDAPVWGDQDKGFFAVVTRAFNVPELISLDGTSRRTEPIPPPSAGAQRVGLTIVSSSPSPRASPELVAKYVSGGTATYALISFQDGRWTETERGDHLRALVRIEPNGERIVGVPEAPFETSAVVRLSADDLWAVADGTFLFRRMR